MIIPKIKELEIAMARRGFTGSGLAKSTGISKCYVMQILSGKRTVLAPTAKKICDVLNFEFNELFDLKTEKDKES